MLAPLKKITANLPANSPFQTPSNSLFTANSVFSAIPSGSLNSPHSADSKDSTLTEELKAVEDFGALEYYTNPEREAMIRLKCKLYPAHQSLFAYIFRTSLPEDNIG